MTKTGLELAKIRSDYQKAALDETETGPDPVIFFQKWLQQAQEAEITEVNAMTLATVDASGMPHARIVLLKGLEREAFIFFTNYESNKGKQLLRQNKAALLFFWKELERQVRIEGRVEKLPAEASDDYFHSRPRGSQISAAASPQSQIIESRAALEQKVTRLTETYAAGDIPRPDHWGGYKLVPHFIEFWQGRSNRLHDRIAFEKQIDQNWKKYRLAP